MNLLVFRMEVFLGCDPRLFKDLCVANFVENTVTYNINLITKTLLGILTAQKEEIHLVVDGEFFDIWDSYNDVGVASELLALCLDVAKCPRN